MGPPSHQELVRFRVLLDGRPPGSSSGLDVGEDGQGSADYQRLYQLVRQGRPVGDRVKHFGLSG
jgi:hypothetical protein